LFFRNRVSDALLLFNDVLNKGFDGSHFITGLSSHCRDLLVSKDAATLPLLEVGASIPLGGKLGNLYQGQFHQ